MGNTWLVATDTGLQEARALGETWQRRRTSLREVVGLERLTDDRNQKVNLIYRARKLRDETGLERFVEDSTDGLIGRSADSLENYSCRNATIGSRRDAFRAGR